MIEIGQVTFLYVPCSCFFFGVSNANLFSCLCLNIAQNLFRGEEKEIKKGKVKKGRAFVLPHCYEVLMDVEKWKDRDDQEESKKRKAVVDLDDEEEASSDDGNRSPTPNSVPYSKPKRPNGSKKEAKEKKKKKKRRGDDELTNAMHALLAARKKTTEVRRMARSQDVMDEERRDDLSPYSGVAPIVEHKVEVQVNEYPQYEFGGSAPIKDDGHDSHEEYERQHNIVGDVEAQLRHDDMDPDIVYQRACVDESDDEGPANELDEDGFTEKEAEWYTKITDRDHKVPLFCDVSLVDKALVDGGMSKTIEARMFPSSTPDAISTSYLKKGVVQVLAVKVVQVVALLWPEDPAVVDMVVQVVALLWAEDPAVVDVVVQVVALLWAEDTPMVDVVVQVVALLWGEDPTVVDMVAFLWAEDPAVVDVVVQVLMEVLWVEVRVVVEECSVTYEDHFRMAASQPNKEKMEWGRRRMQPVRSIG
ncbi:hypothetical protein D1007_05712 [Hordeum vulgare]|nr:hypothetical protein D1007_05712 [Hordeum vulgare]